MARFCRSLDWIREKSTGNPPRFTGKNHGFRDTFPEKTHHFTVLFPEKKLGGSGGESRDLKFRQDFGGVSAPGFE